MKKAMKILLIFMIAITSSFFLYILFSPTPYVYKPNCITYTNINNDIYHTEINGEYSSYIPLSKISVPIQKTLIAVEDKSFYSHNGIDYPRTIKAALENIKSKSYVQGGSTITQQLARIIFLDNSKSISRKLNEAVISKKLESSYSKDLILELYLNCVFFGHNLYGINAACQYYFNLSPSQIDYAQASILIGLLPSPNTYAPDINLKECLKRQKLVLNSLLAQDIIDKEKYDFYCKEKLNFTYSLNNDNLPYKYYYDAVDKFLLEEKIITSKRNTECLEIETFINNQVQVLIQKIIDKYISLLSDDLEVSIVVMEPYSSKVLGLCGGNKYIDSSFNRAIESKRQIGSTIKPLIYYIALDNGFTPLTVMDSRPTTFHLDSGIDYAPSNANGNYANRKITLLEALSVSDNIYSMKTSLFLGLSKIKKLLANFSLDTRNIDSTIGLGTLEITPLELCSIYNAFASEGLYYAPRFVNRVIKKEKYTIYNNIDSKKRVFNKENTIIMNYMLKSPFDSVFYTYAKPSLLSYPLNATFCAKTGTTDSSSWVVGFNKKYTICVYLGSDYNNNLHDTKIAKSIFQDLANNLCPKDIEFYSVPSTCEEFQLKNKTNNVSSFKYIRKK